MSLEQGLCLSDTEVAGAAENSPANQCALCPVLCVSRSTQTVSLFFLRCWNLKSLNCLYLINCLHVMNCLYFMPFCPAGHQGDVDVVRWHPNCHYVATASSDRTCRLWDVNSGACCRYMLGLQAAPTCMAIHPDGRQVWGGRGADNMGRGGRAMVSTHGEGGGRGDRGGGGNAATRLCNQVLEESMLGDAGAANGYKKRIRSDPTAPVFSMMRLSSAHAVINNPLISLSPGAFKFTAIVISLWCPSVPPPLFSHPLFKSWQSYIQYSVTPPPVFRWLWGRRMVASWCGIWAVRGA